MNNLYSITKQFGILYLVKGVIKRVIAPIFKYSHHYILSSDVQPDYGPNKNVKVLDLLDYDEFLNSGIIIDLKLQRQAKSFKDNCKLVVYIDNNITAGWGFIQKEGSFKYSNFEVIIPPGFELLKNLYVLNEYRGKSIGKILNEQRLCHITKNKLPIVFVLTDNKYAIRNLKLFSMETQIKISDYTFFSLFDKRIVKQTNNSELARRIASGFLKKGN